MPEVIQIALAFTRYLYQMLEVKQSLFLALIDHNPEEALYWLYELYYSGFEKEVYDYVLLIYEMLYKHLHPSLHAAILAKYQNWLENGSNPETDADIGSIIYTLALRSYCLVDFMRKYYNVNITSTTTEALASSQFIVKLTPEYIRKYKTFIQDGTSTVRTYKILEHVVKYPIRKECNKLFYTHTHQNFPAAFRNKWLYYASFSPVWYNRIVEHNGYVDYDTERIVFESEDCEDSFRSKWDYEPDEVSNIVYTRCCGNGKEVSFSVKEFCEKYNYTIHSRIIKKPKKIENTMQETDM
jgi:hypothetical protein